MATLEATRSTGTAIEGALEDVNVPSYRIDRHGVIRWINAAARRIVGDVVGRQFTSVVAPEDTREAREAFSRKVIGRDRATDVEVDLLAADGARLTVEISSAPLREDNRIIGVFGLITQQRAALPPHPHPQLTPRQAQILRMLADGDATAQIAGELHLSIETVRNHVRHALRALGVHSRLEAIALARRDGILD